MKRLALAVALLTTAPLVAAAPKPPTSAAKEPAPSGVAPPADDAVIAGSCKLGKESCVDFEGTFPNGEGAARCKRLKGSWRDESCTADGRIGTCSVRDTGTDNRLLTRWYRPATEKGAKESCKKQPRAAWLNR